MSTEIISEDGLELPERWAQLRPEQLKPEQFLSLTKDLYGPAAPPPDAPDPAEASATSSSSPEVAKRKPVWRTGFKRTIPVNNSDHDEDDDEDDDDEK